MFPRPLLLPFQSHGHTSTGEWLSTALWAGLVVLASLAVAGALVAVKVLARRRAQRTRPCPACGRFFDPSSEPACPYCGRGSVEGGPRDRRPPE
jgi:hypothetical protein